MRTTLDIDQRVLAAARSRVHSGKSKSIGEAVSDLALRGIASEAPPHVDVDGLVLLPSTPGLVITDEMVAAALLDE